MSTTTALATTTTAASASATATGCGNLYDIPAHDASCAMAYGGNHTDIMAQCCGSADVVSYYDGCGLYCLAVDQTVGDLTDCLYARGAAYQDVFCYGNTTATATATDATLPASASASVVSTAGSSSSTSGASSSDGAAATGTDSPGSAAAGLRPDYGVVKVGVAIGALLVSATAFGAFQI
ncbi:hypothetical protein F5X96DRAFT_659446 [Biscogniauxia mediterranea]|nr:hypothetical protein F5X96DRAFT_659446 [Biscogniauxia mediterranea]